ncbi:nicotinate mononucleotide-dependent phosphoribosyltransferase CobT [Methanoregula sp.]|uniref:nicotinate mononucleotide-dependent phosphoribosyltransferase CobT n=1 Tax=Methanoregula sp. TaxID=2052170 RepID=UPI00260C448C|nr:TIGR00303 family protein [Methanoregula sp.]MDD5143568.1 TIGR00303 family protein [Methanoregula sp.]
MAFISGNISPSFTRPLFCGILANTLLSTVPGVSGAGPSPEKTLLTPVLDAELIATGNVTSYPFKPNTPTGCPTPSTITRAMLSLCGLPPFFINAGLRHTPTVPCYDLYGQVGEDPRTQDAVPNVQALFGYGESLGRFFSRACDLLVVAECVPGGTTTALCVLRALGYDAAVSSSFIENPVSIKEKICSQALARITSDAITDPLDIVRYTGDPMMPVAAGMITTYTGNLLLAGGTQMLSVAALAKALGKKPPAVVTTSYVRDDPTANVMHLADRIGSPVYYVDPGFGDLGHPGLARYCIGEVKEGFGAGGAMYLAHLMGHSEAVIREKILSAARACS